MTKRKSPDEVTKMSDKIEKEVLKDLGLEDLRLEEEGEEKKEPKGAPEEGLEERKPEEKPEEKEEEKLKSEIQKVKEEISRVEAEIAKTEKKLADFEIEFETLETKKVAKPEALDEAKKLAKEELEAYLAKQKGYLEELQKHLSELEAKLKVIQESKEKIKKEGLDIIKIREEVLKKENFGEAIEKFIKEITAENISNIGTLRQKFTEYIEEALKKDHHFKEDIDKGIEAKTIAESLFPVIYDDLERTIQIAQAQKKGGKKEGRLAKLTKLTKGSLGSLGAIWGGAKFGAIFMGVTDLALRLTGMRTLASSLAGGVSGVLTTTGWLAPENKIVRWLQGGKEKIGSRFKKLDESGQNQVREVTKENLFTFLSFEKMKRESHSRWSDEDLLEETGLADDEKNQIKRLFELNRDELTLGARAPMTEEQREAFLEERKNIINNNPDALKTLVTKRIEKLVEPLKEEIEKSTLSRDEKDKLITGLLAQSSLEIEKEVNFLMGDVVAQEKFGADKEKLNLFGDIYKDKLGILKKGFSLLQGSSGEFISQDTSVLKKALIGFAVGAAGGAFRSRASDVAGIMFAASRFRGAFVAEAMKEKERVVKTAGETLKELNESAGVGEVNLTEARDLINEARARIKLPDTKEMDRIRIEVVIQKLQNKIINQETLKKMELPVVMEDKVAEVLENRQLTEDKAKELLAKAEEDKKLWQNIMAVKEKGWKVLALTTAKATAKAAWAGGLAAFGAGLFDTGGDLQESLARGADMATLGYAGDWIRDFGETPQGQALNGLQRELQETKWFVGGEGTDTEEVNKHFQAYLEAQTRAWGVGEEEMAETTDKISGEIDTDRDGLISESELVQAGLARLDLKDAEGNELGDTTSEDFPKDITGRIEYFTHQDLYNRLGFDSGQEAGKELMDFLASDENFYKEGKVDHEFLTTLAVGLEQFSDEKQELLKAHKFLIDDALENRANFVKLDDNLKGILGVGVLGDFLDDPAHKDQNELIAKAVIEDPQKFERWVKGIEEMASPQEKLTFLQNHKEILENPDLLDEYQDSILIAELKLTDLEKVVQGVQDSELRKELIKILEDDPKAIRRLDDQLDGLGLTPENRLMILEAYPKAIKEADILEDLKDDLAKLGLDTPSEINEYLNRMERVDLRGKNLDSSFGKHGIEDPGQRGEILAIHPELQDQEAIIELDELDDHFDQWEPLTAEERFQILTQVQNLEGLKTLDIDFTDERLASLGLAEKVDIITAQANFPHLLENYEKLDADHDGQLDDKDLRNAFADLGVETTLEALKLYEQGLDEVQEIKNVDGLLGLAPNKVSFLEAHPALIENIEKIGKFIGDYPNLDVDLVKFPYLAEHPEVLEGVLNYGALDESFDKLALEGFGERLEFFAEHPNLIEAQNFEKLIYGLDDLGLAHGQAKLEFLTAHPEFMEKPELAGQIVAGLKDLGLETSPDWAAKFIESPEKLHDLKVGFGVLGITDPTEIGKFFTSYPKLAEGWMTNPDLLLEAEEQFVRGDPAKNIKGIRSNAEQAKAFEQFCKDHKEEVLDTPEKVNGAVSQTIQKIPAPAVGASGVTTGPPAGQPVAPGGVTPPVAPGEVGPEVVTPEEVKPIEIKVTLGKEGVPAQLERFFQMVSVDHMQDVLGEDQIFGEEEAAKSLNMAANLVELAQGHAIAGISPEAFSACADYDSETGEIHITDYAKFGELLNEVEGHAAELWQNEVLQKGALAYADNIKTETWRQEIIKAQGLEQAGIAGHEEEVTVKDFAKSEMVTKAEDALALGMLREAGIDFDETKVEFLSDEDSIRAVTTVGEALEIKDGQLVRIGELDLASEPLPVGPNLLEKVQDYQLEKLIGKELVPQAKEVAVVTGILTEGKTLQSESLGHLDNFFKNYKDDLGAFQKDGKFVGENLIFAMVHLHHEDIDSTQIKNFLTVNEHFNSGLGISRDPEEGFKKIGWLADKRFDVSVGQNMVHIVDKTDGRHLVIASDGQVSQKGLVSLMTTKELVTKINPQEFEEEVFSKVTGDLNRRYQAEDYAKDHLAALTKEKWGRDLPPEKFAELRSLKVDQLDEWVKSFKWYKGDFGYRDNARAMADYVKQEVGSGKEGLDVYEALSLSVRERVEAGAAGPEEAAGLTPRVEEKAPAKPLTGIERQAEVVFPGIPVAGEGTGEVRAGESPGITTPGEESEAPHVHVPGSEMTLTLEEEGRLDSLLGEYPNFRDLSTKQDREAVLKMLDEDLRQKGLGEEADLLEKHIRIEWQK